MPIFISVIPIPSTIQPSEPAAEQRESVYLIAQHGPAITLDDLILPTEVIDRINGFIASVRHAGAVAAALGHLRHLSERNVLNLWGPPGVGKSKLAAAMANTIGKPLYSLNAFSILCKPVDESEQNVRQALIDVRRLSAVLLIDEADSLISKRNPANSGGELTHNSTLNHLIQQLNVHDGVVILASNQRAGYHDAIAQRIVDVHLPAPNAVLRRQMWLRILAIPAMVQPPDQLWLANLDNKVKRAILCPDRPFTAADMEQIVVAAIGTAAVKSAGQPLTLSRRDVHRALDQHLTARAPVASTLQPTQDLAAAASLIGANLAQDALLAEALANVLDLATAVDPANITNAHAELARIHKLFVGKIGTIEGQFRTRVEAMRRAGLATAVNVGTVRSFSKQMRATVDKRSRKQDPA